MSVAIWVVKVAGRSNYVLRWNDPQTGRRRQKATDIKATARNKRLAERSAAELAAKIDSDTLELGSLPWCVFRQRYEDEHLSGLAAASGVKWQSAANHFDRICAPLDLADVTARKLSTFVVSLRKSGKAETTIASYLRTLHAALTWGIDNDFLTELPKFPRIKRAKGGRSFAKGRPLSTEEFERMLAAAAKVRPDDAAIWAELLEGLWWSGLRLGEAVDLSWSPRSKFGVDLAEKFPLFRIRTTGEKGHRDRVLPVAPEFGEWLREAPEADRRGKVFLAAKYARKTVSHVVCEIGAKAGVIVNEDGKTASAHDLRRSFGTRWSRRLQPAELRELMRHRDITTTLEYYVDIDAIGLAERLEGYSRDRLVSDETPCD